MNRQQLYNWLQSSPFDKFEIKDESPDSVQISFKVDNNNEALKPLDKGKSYMEYFLGRGDSNGL
jgi:hypothetical protein